MLFRSTPFDWGSRGRVPDQSFGGEVGQRFYENSDSSGSDSEASISGAADPVFYCYGIYSSLIVSDLERIRGRYH